MSVESGARRQLADSRASPMARCVCNLCDCGLHSCRTTPVEWARGGSTEAASPGAAINRCASQDLANITPGKEGEESAHWPDRQVSGNNRPNLREAKMDSPIEGSLQDWQQQEGPNCKHLATDCFAERYLARSPIEPSMQKDELMQLLVSRPAIAGKPRDNILFEGEMDLRTTFETSYEVLAKMRLEQWRRHQDELERQRRKAASQHTQQKVNGDELPVDANYNGQTSSTEVGPSSGKSAKVNELGQVSVGSRIDKQAKPLGLSRSPQTEQPSVGKLMVQRETQTPSATDFTNEAKNEGPQAHSRGNHIDTTHIDPDLSPIIVYNANMNRLDQVGLRRRSKYRPSTSLRSGARGFFGDQELSISEPMGATKDLYSQQVKVNREIGAGLVNETSSSHRDTQKEAAKQEAALERREVALDKRNLTHSNQANYLTYSAHNLPVDAKRKVVNNINMTDHIREHNIVDEPMGPVSGEMSTEWADATQDLTAHKQQDEEERRVAEREEAEAVAEIQRLMPEQEAHTIKPDSTGKEAQSGRGRLRRTCQNQNFDIFLSEYPKQMEQSEQPVKLALPKPAPQASPQPAIRLYNNLFRESPDFILTTGKFLEQEARQDRQRSETRIMNSALEDVRQAEQVAADIQLPKRSDLLDCKVLKLDKDFRYVGSQFGHKYFVEDPSANLEQDYDTIDN